MPFRSNQEAIKEETDKRPTSDSSHSPEPLALLIHPSQPLSYLERLIQAEIPPVRIRDRERSPDIVFRAEADPGETPERTKTDGTNVAAYSGLGREGPTKNRDEANWVRWSSSTEVGDFIRDAARGREFTIGIEGHDTELRIAVPSFKDRTYYLRTRLRRMSREIDSMSHLKNECDLLAHKGAHRLAKGGFGALASWWCVVYYVTFHTEMGWDLVEPVTYLAGLTTIMGGYLWFLFISRDLSYKAAMNVTVTKRQNALYQERGFDQHKWELLVHEANAMRREIRIVASEYDVDWDEIEDLGGHEVRQALEDEKSDRAKKEDEAEDADREEKKAEKDEEIARENKRKRDID